MKYLVTGGAGFIGCNLVRELERQKNDVVILDNFHTGSNDNIKNLNAEVIKGISRDLSQDDLDCFDGIFHIGIPSSAPMYKKNKQLIGNAINDFVYLRENYEDKIVMSCSSSVYNGISTPHLENMLIEPTDFYTETRLSMERLGELYFKLYKRPYIGLRLFSVYGPHEGAKGRYANMISQFLWSIQKDEEIIVYGDGTQTRDFTYVGDVVQTFISAMEKKLSYGIFNVGTGKSYTFNEIISILKRKVGKNPNVSYKENPIKNYVEHTLADTKKLRDFFPHMKKPTSLEDGIERILGD